MDLAQFRSRLVTAMSLCRRGGRSGQDGPNGWPTMRFGSVRQCGSDVGISQLPDALPERKSFKLVSWDCEVAEGLLRQVAPGAAALDALLNGVGVVLSHAFSVVVVLSGGFVTNAHQATSHRGVTLTHHTDAFIVVYENRSARRRSWNSGAGLTHTHVCTEDVSCCEF